jgi:hypothetical protein
VRLTLEMALLSDPKLPLLLALIAGAAAASCAKRAEDAPSETAASQAPAPMAAPEAPASPAPAEAAARPGAAPPTSLQEGEDEESRGLVQPESPITSLSEAERAFADSEQQLTRLIGPLEAGKAKGERAPTPLASGDARCPRACKAFDSLRRAGDAICRLAGNADARCGRAKDVVKQNQARVSACGCSDNGSER